MKNFKHESAQDLKIPARFDSIISTLTDIAKRNGYIIYAVGGFVRDLLLGREPHDLDIMVEGPNGGIGFAELAAKELGLHAPTTFPRFGTAMLPINNEQIEFVMPRSEFYTEESRKPDTTLGTLEQDAMRRDFSINALFLRLNDMELLDLTGHGKEDLQKGIIRVTDPDAADVIFSQDPLRMLRAIRQSLQLGFEIDPDTVEAIRRNASRLDIISKERIRDEISKLLVQATPSRGITFLKDTGLLPYVLPELQKLIRTEQPRKWHSKDVWEHTMQVLDSSRPELVDRLAALLHDVGKPATQKIVEDTIHFFGHEDVGEDMAREVLKRLKFPNDMVDQVAFAVGSHMRPHTYDQEWTDTAVRRFVRDMGEHLERVLALAESDITSSRPERVEEGKQKVNDLRKRIDELQKEIPVSEYKTLLTGDELMELFGEEPGPWIKTMKDYLAEQQLAKPELTKEEAIELAKAYYPSLERQADLLAIELFQPGVLPGTEDTCNKQEGSDNIPIGTKVKSIAEGTEGTIVGYASRNETGTDVDLVIHWDEPLLDQYEVSEVHPTEIEILERQAALVVDASYDNLTVQTSDIPKELLDQIKTIQSKIDKEQLYTGEDEPKWVEGGLQKLFHITILFGVNPKDQEGISQVVKEYIGKGIATETDNIEYFDKEEDGYTVAVVRMRVDKGLANLHKALKDRFENKTSYPEYKAHITIAYLQPGERLEGASLNPVNWQIKSIEMSNKDGSLTKVSYQRQAWLKKAFEPDHPEKVKIQDDFEPLTEQQIYDYWKSSEAKILPVIQGKPIMLFIQVDGKIVRKRNTDDGQLIIVNSKEDYERYVATGGTVSIHMVYPQHMTTVAHIELDPREQVPFDKVKKIAAALYDRVDTSESPLIKNVSLRYSGNRGFYLLINLSEETDINQIRANLKDMLNDFIQESGDPKLTTSATKDPESIRLDISTVMPRGTLRAPYSLHEKTGLVSVPLKLEDLKTFEKENAKIENVKGVISPVALPEKQFKNDEKNTSAYWTNSFFGRQSMEITDLEPGYKGKFVVTEHLAKHAGRHWDLRLEYPTELSDRYQTKREFEKTPEPAPIAGKSSLRSWAVRNLNQLLDGTKDKILAVSVEDHPVEYAKFEGTIPEGSYGAGTVTIFDSGTWALLKKSPDSLTVNLNGSKLKGTFNLINTKEDQWLLRKAQSEEHNVA